MYINFFFVFYSVFSLLSPLFSFCFSLSMLLSLSLLCSLSLSLKSTARWRWLWVGGCSVMGWWLFPDLLVMVVRGGDGVCVWVCRRWWVSRSDFSPPSRPWLQTKWVVVGLGLLAWVWWLCVWVCWRGCGGYGRLLLLRIIINCCRVYQFRINTKQHNSWRTSQILQLRTTTRVR